ncbi:hypothetical protein [Palleronia abyssalis]|uniref:Uncharacterized protein n=1 Tax=Palleronia abyssalis TaxID=1501240 RepID=A0A2R8BUX8_9RHOB|nr:hypothetical protein [Palleronia abyssalis]SPJ23984.1 hypothetical protein PAA8504_01806 [Palleronia abyssalis]
MKRLLIACILLTACDLPQLDTPVATTPSRADFPMLAPFETISRATETQSPQLAALPAELDSASAQLRARTASTRTGLSPGIAAELTDRAAQLRARAAVIRANAEGDATLLERMRRLRERAATY